MGNSAAVRHLVDLLMTVVLVLLMAYFLMEQEIHEWLGAGVLVLFIAHHILNRKWLKALNRGEVHALPGLADRSRSAGPSVYAGFHAQRDLDEPVCIRFPAHTGAHGAGKDGASAVRLLGISPAVGPLGPPLGDHVGRGAEGSREQETVYPPHCGPPGADCRDLRLWCVRLLQAPHCRLSLFTKPLCILRL